MTDLTTPDAAASKTPDFDEAHQRARRLRRGSVVASVASNFAGAFVVFLYLGVLGPGTPALGAHKVDTALLFLGILVVTSVGGVKLFTWLAGSLNQALATAAPIIGSNRQTLIALSARVAMFSLVNWIISAGIFGLYDSTLLHDTTVDAVRLGLSVVLGGLTTTALVYLLNERAVRPMYALAFATESPTEVSGLGLELRMALTWALGAGIPMLGIALAYLGHPSHDFDTVRRTVLAAAVIAVASGALIARLMARAVVRPVDSVRLAMARVQAGDTNVKVDVDDASEIGLLQAGFNDMVTGLQERAVLEDLFGRHVGIDVARHAMERGVGLHGEQRDVSVLFIDVIGSTMMAATQPAAEVFSLLNEVFAAVVRETTTAGGWINKFEGDAALCVFGAPGDLPDHAARSLQAARAIRLALDDLGRRHPGLDAGIGVSSGPVVAGNIGAEQRFEYSLIGDAVNEAARLTAEAKVTAGRVLASEQTVAMAGAGGESWRRIGSSVLRGRTRPTVMFAPVELPSPTVR
ncbi:MAG TPA: adenylate/guanylate cyclase domain-containing protein [Acidimicrobiales bacterium]